MHLAPCSLFMIATVHSAPILMRASIHVIKYSAIVLPPMLLRLVATPTTLVKTGASLIVPAFNAADKPESPCATPKTLLPAAQLFMDNAVESDILTISFKF